jgi:hypothetical protein
MPIRWSPLKVNEAADMLEDYVNQAVEPLEQARIVAREALKIPDLPQYVTQHFFRIIGEIDRAIGGGQWDSVGQVKAGIQSVRESLPDGAVEAENQKLGNGKQLSLVR